MDIQIHHLGATIKGDEDHFVAVGLRPHDRYNVVITYPSGLQQHYNVASNSQGMADVTHPVLEDGDVHVEFTEPTLPLDWTALPPGQPTLGDLPIGHHVRRKAAVRYKPTSPPTDLKARAEELYEAHRRLLEAHGRKRA